MKKRISNKRAADVWIYFLYIEIKDLNIGCIILNNAKNKHFRRS